MWRTRIKFCGITRVEDALAAAELGADAIGLVLHANSIRQIEPQRARQIMSALPPFVTPVGLFVDALPEQVAEMVIDLGLRHVQLHGQETAAHIAALRGRTIIKAIHVSEDTLGRQLTHWRTQIAQSSLDHLKGLVLETHSQTQAGGTGEVNDWASIRAHQDAGHFDDLPPIIAAGGLRPENVAEVVRLLRPWAVDVSSGIESEKGIKSPIKMAAFVEAVRRADMS